MPDHETSCPDSSCSEHCCGCQPSGSGSSYPKGIFLILAAAVFLATALILENFPGDYSSIGTYCAIICLGLTAIPIVRNAVSGLLKGERNVCELAALAIIGGVIIGEYTVAAEISFIMSIGELVEEYIYARSRKDIEGIISRHPRFSRILVNGEPVETEVSRIIPGDLVIVRPGDIVPVDGIITEGISDLDESCVTGESLPVTRKPGEPVCSGSINLDGSLIIETVRTSGTSTYAKIVEMVSAAGKRRPPSSLFIDRFSRWYTPVMLLLAGIVLVWTGSVVRAITVLVVACPCAILLATPSAVLAAIGHAATRGILIKGGEYLEVCREITTVIFDKTGTLSTGEMTVSAVLPAGGCSPEEILQLAGSIEKASPHPVGKAIVKEAGRRRITLPAFREIRQYPGMGIEGMHGESVIRIGSRQFMNQTGVSIPDAIPGSKKVTENEIIVSRNREYIGTILVSDQVREEVSRVLAELHSIGIDDLTILTGDTAEAAEIMGRQCGLPQERIVAGLLPQEKQECIEKLQKSGKKVCFVGDGTNDGPALAGADLGISIAGREDTVALETAGVVLMKGGLVHLPEFLMLGKRTARIILTSVVFALGLSGILIIGASLGTITPAAGAVGHQAATILVLANSLRLAKKNQ
jgi:Cd2+/Zn2+-exporting ATPase